MDTQPYLPWPRDSHRPVKTLTRSVGEAAEMIGVSKPTIYRLIRRQELRPIRSIRHLRIPTQEVERFIRES